MTELEILAHAKTYIEKLANGIDPLSDEAVPENDTINQVRISRCLFYVAGVLEQVIENGGVNEKPKKHEKKQAYSIDAASLEQYRFSERPISVSEMVRQLNDLSQADNMKKLTYNQVADWLISQGVFVGIAEQSGRKTKRPTEKGALLGITVENRTGQHGPYTAVLFDLNAQQFIISHLPDILAFSSAPETDSEQAMPKAPGRTDWTADDDDFLLTLLRSGASRDEMRRALHRDPTDIEARLRVLNDRQQNGGGKL